MRVRVGVSVLCLVLTLPVLAAAQARPFAGPDVQQIYQRLLPQIEKIPAFDHHAHPGYADDPDVDAMAAPPNASEALRTRDDNPELAAAAKALFGYPYNDLSPEHAKWLLNKKNELKKQLAGTAYFDSILDKINIESSVANRAMMPDYLDAKRFPWVFFADAFMWPFNNERETARNPDEGVYIPLQEKMLHRWMQQENVGKLPASFADYLKFISQTLEENSKRGGIAMKFEVAYFRPTTFSDPTASAGRRSLRALREWRNSHGEGVSNVPGLHFPIPGAGRRAAASPGSHPHGSGDRRLLQPVGKQHHESGKRAAGSALCLDHVRDDSRGISAGARGDLAGCDEERLPGYLVWGVGAVSVGVQGNAEDVPGNFSRQDHFRHRLFPVQSGAGSGRELLAGRAVLAHGAWPRPWPR